MNEDTKQRDTFIFYRSFKESMSDLSDTDKLIMYEAITDYSLDMKEPELTGFPKALFSLIRPFLDANTQRWKNGCKGGAPKGNKNNRFSKSTTEVQPEVNQSTTEVQANKDKNVNKDKNKDIIKENTIVSKKDELSLSSPSEEFIKFNKWLEETCPFVLIVKAQMSEREYNKLTKKYTKKEICDVLESLNNWRDFPKKRASVYRSTLDELKKKFGER